MKTSNGWKIYLDELIDDLGDGHEWGEWTCEIELPNGEIIKGGVQGDPYMIAEETLVDEDGTPFTEEFINAHSIK